MRKRKGEGEEGKKNSSYHAIASALRSGKEEERRHLTCKKRGALF